MKRVLVIATAAKEGGALSILSQFINSTIEDLYYTFLVDESVLKILPKKKNITYQAFPKKNIFRRLYFDLFEVTKIIKLSRSDVCFNLQNVPVRTNIKQLVYMHQPIPFTDLRRLNIKFNATIFFYKYLYFLLIKFNDKYAYSYIVQTEWLKRRLSLKLKRKTKDVLVFKPLVEMVSKNALSDKKNERLSAHDKSFDFVYPASAISYKNHEFLIEIFSQLDKEWLHKHNVKLYLTIQSETIQKKVLSLGLNNIVFFVGYLNRDKVFDLYSRASALIFPSLIETYGLPLIEAAYFNLPVVTVDLDYSKEVLSGYKKVLFCNISNVKQWSDAIVRVVESGFPADCDGFSNLNDEWLNLHHYILKEAKVSQLYSPKK